MSEDKFEELEEKYRNLVEKLKAEFARIDKEISLLKETEKPKAKEEKKKSWWND